MMSYPVLMREPVAPAVNVVSPHTVHILVAGKQTELLAGFASVHPRDMQWTQLGATDGGGVST